MRKGIELNQDDVTWFEEQYPNGSLSGVIQMLFSRFREANEKTPHEYAEIAAKQLTEELRR